nr:hypothetical protein [uncultured Lachnoclostridium sp.]
MSDLNKSLDLDNAIANVDEQVKKGNFARVLNGSASVIWAYGAGDRAETNNNEM